jgi:hypothetical protein
MQLKIVLETEYLKADLRGRETPEEMRQAISTILTECRKTGMSSVLISTRASRPLFKVQEFGLSAFLDEMSSSCRVALVAESEELRASDEYIATMAQQKKMNVRAFHSEALAARWLQNGAPGPSRRYRFTRIVLAGSPNEPGVYALWQGEELIYYGRAHSGSSIRARLQGHFEDRVDATHYSWEISRDPAKREGELLREYQQTFGRLPRLNEATA